MPDFITHATIWNMLPAGRVDVLVLEEFRLHAVDTDGAAAAIVSAASDYMKDPIPLLTSIEDPRDVATLRTVVAGTADDHDPRADGALGTLVESWQPAKRYRSRISARSQAMSPSSFRLAVTESGINDEQVGPAGAWVGGPTTGEPIALLLIGMPEGTHAGLIVLVGRDMASTAIRSDGDWPLALTRDLGVRIYESSLVPRPAAPLM